MDNKILIAVPTAEMARRGDFYDYLNLLDKPLGTMLSMAHGQSPARNRNVMIDMGLANGCTHFLFIDDDVAFKPSLLKDLLKHDVDIVGGLYYMRSYPHTPIAFDIVMPDGRCMTRFLNDGDSGLVEVVGMGLGCCLIKAQVFRDMERPWIRLGELEPDHWCDDLGFFKRVREKGYKIHLDLDVMVGHMAQVIVWPTKMDGKWMTTYDTKGRGVASIPQSTKPMESVEVGG